MKSGKRSGIKWIKLLDKKQNENGTKSRLNIGTKVNKMQNKTWFEKWNEKWNSNRISKLV